ncbi:MAG: sodium/glutamate symporter [Methanobacteriaceae archaeon]|nr:sodium/glutamate symporter [Methanobacteriaceae archaeon]
MSPAMVGLSFIVLGLILLIGKLIRIKSKILQRLFIPSSLIGGFIALILGPDILGSLINLIGLEGTFLSNGLFPLEMLEVWVALPGLLINIIFATLFLGKRIPGLRDIWNIAGPQVAHGQTIAWGQYVFGIIITILVLTPFFSINPMAGALIEIGFEGGHGTAAGMGETFNKLGFPEGTDLALGLATIGILFGVIMGILFLNIAIKKGETSAITSKTEISSTEMAGIFELDNRVSAGKLTTRTESIEPLSLHLAYVGLAIGLGIIILQSLIFLEELTWGSATGLYLISFIPLFPFAMIGGIILEKLLDRFDVYRTLDRDLIVRIQGLSLDVLILSAVATLSLVAIGDNIFPFILLAIVGIFWNVVVLVYIAPLMIPSYWFERAIGDFGQSMGMTATGILLMKLADPDNKTPAMS